LGWYTEDKNRSYKENTKEANHSKERDKEPIISWTAEAFHKMSLLSGLFLFSFRFWIGNAISERLGSIFKGADINKRA
jgi:hypothetical protein